MRILRAIVSGERDAEVLVAFRDVRCKSSVETIRDALTGNYQPEHVFALRQAIELYDAYQAKVHDCDAEIERCLRALPTDATATPPPPRSRATQKNEPAFEVRPVLHALLGVDLIADQRHRPLLRPPHRCRVRHGHEPVAHGEALHVVAHAGARQQDLRRQGTQLREPDRVRAEVHEREYREGGSIV